MAGNRVPSLHLNYDEKFPGDIVIQEVCVPESGSAKYTYYCCIGWNNGRSGSGYCGIQDHPDGKCYIFSIWDPQNSSEPITAAFKGPGTWTKRFGGEGTGLKSMNFDLGWKPDHWYTFVIRRWDHHGHTRYGLWVQDQKSGIWTHLITMDFPEPDCFFEDVNSFLEDWYGNGHSLRSVKYRKGLKRNQDNSWSPLQSATFSVNQEEACKNYNDNFNACVNSGCYFLQSGQSTCPDKGLGTRKKLYCACEEHHGAQNTLPSQFPIRFTIKSVSDSHITWNVDEQQTPQFKYTIKEGDTILMSEVDTETRTCQVDLTKGSQITVILEDILGRKCSVSYLYK